MEHFIKIIKLWQSYKITATVDLDKYLHDFRADLAWFILEQLQNEDYLYKSPVISN